MTAAPHAPTDLTCDHQRDPLGIDSAAPRLGWSVSGPGRGLRQSAYRIIVASSAERIAAGLGDLGDTGRVASAEQVAQTCPGMILQPRSAYWWQVMIWDQHGNASPWSRPATFGTAILAPGDWTAGWFRAASYRVHTARKEFRIDAGRRIASARVLVAATGEGGLGNTVELLINGRRIGRDVLSPGMTYADTALHQTYDTTAEVRPGANAIGVMYATTMSVELRITFTDGSVQVVASDATWRVTTGGPYTELRYPHLLVGADTTSKRRYGQGRGEVYDARNELGAWCEPGFDDASWSAQPLAAAPAHLRARCDAVAVIERLAPVSIRRQGSDRHTVDFGQNVHGTVVITVSGPAGTKVDLTFAEVLDAQGNVLTDSVVTSHKDPEGRPAYHRDTYILKGDGRETYRPRFSSHVFQHVEVAGHAGALQPDDIRAEVIHSDIITDATFRCSHAMLDGLHRLARWTFRDNLVSVPLDCPGKERRAWLGDAFMVSEACGLTLDVARVYREWFQALRSAQSDAGDLPFYAPGEDRPFGDVIWPSAVVLIAWDHYQLTGDRAFLADQYGLMRSWVGFLRSLADDAHLIRSHCPFNDWVGADQPSPAFTATAYYHRCVDLLGHIAAELGHAEDAAGYARLRERIAAGIVSAFRSDGPRYDTDTQCVDAMALHFGFIPADDREAIAARLVADLRRHRGRTVGSVGTYSLFPALADSGRNDVALALLTDTRHLACWPRWLLNGRTTAPEHFDDRPLNSLCHPFLIGSADAWLFREIAGVRVTMPGFAAFSVRPPLLPEVTSATGWLRTPRGLAGAEWSITGSDCQLLVRVPGNAVATVHVPAREGSEVTEGGVAAERAAGVSFVGREGAYALYRVGSGEYRFASRVDVPQRAPPSDPVLLHTSVAGTDGRSLPAGWSVEPAGAVTIAPPPGSDARWIRVHGGGAGSSVLMKHAVAPTGGVVYVEADVRADQAGGNLTLSLRAGGADVASVGMETDGEGLTLVSFPAGGRVPVLYLHSTVRKRVEVAVRRTYRLRLVADLPRGVYHVYVDDRLYAKDLACAHRAPAVDGVAIASTGGWEGSFAIDRIVAGAIPSEA